MADKVFGIIGKDVNYNRRLMNAFNAKRGLGVKMQLFTDCEALYRYIDVHHMDVLLFDKGINIDKSKLSGVPSVLSIDEGPKEDGIYKFQSFEETLAQIFAKSGSIKNSLADKGCNAVINCVYSPVSASGKTIFSLALARWYAGKGRTLYINFEEFAGLDRVLNQERDGLSEAAYYYRNNPLQLKEHLSEIIANGQYFDYIPTVKCAEDITFVPVEQWIDIINYIGTECGYRTIVIDAGSGLKEQWQLFSASERVFMPIKNDSVSRSKLEAFERYLRSSGKETDNIVKLIVPWLETEYNEQLLGKIKNLPVWQGVEKVMSC